MTAKMMVSFPEEFLDEVDRLAKEEHRSRSEPVREAIRLYVSLRRDKTRPDKSLRVREADGLVSLPAVKFLGELDVESLTSP